ncbi:MAG: hypothetical protein ACREOO_21540, partial [bacterium]
MRKNDRKNIEKIWLANNMGLAKQAQNKTLKGHILPRIEESSDIMHNSFRGLVFRVLTLVDSRETEYLAVSSRPRP